LSLGINEVDPFTVYPEERVQASALQADLFVVATLTLLVHVILNLIGQFGFDRLYNDRVGRDV
jgi:hypothetical protein